MSNEEKIPVNITIFVTEDTNDVYVKFTGFDCAESADDYAEHLSTYLPLMLFESEVMH